MKKKLSQYLHLYFGCKVEYGYDGTKKIGTLSGKDDLTGWQVNTYKVLAPYLYVRDELIKPILRPLSDMTEDEMQECGNMIYDFSNDEELNKWQPSDFEIGLAPEQFYWLLSRHFDLFNLIPDSLAIDATTL